MNAAEEAGIKPVTAIDGGGSSIDRKLDRKLLILAAVVVLGIMMSILDTTVVNVAVNSLAARFHTTLPTIQWVATGYTLALATVIPLTGWTADRFGTKRLYIVSIVLFLVGSCLSGLAWSSTTIILFRVLQGLGGGMIAPAGITILARAAGPHRIGRVMALMSGPTLLGPILGPILGGWLLDDVGWRWIFFINLPIGIAAILLSLRVLPRDVAVRGQKLDLVDLLLLSPGLALMIYGLAESNSAGGFGSSGVLIPLVAGIALIAMFVWHALRSSEPLIDLRLFRNRTFSTSSLTLMLACIAAFGTFLLLPLYFQTVRGESPLMSGLLLVPQGFGAMIAMQVAGHLADRTGAGRISPFGLIAMLAAGAWLTQIKADTPYLGLSIDLFVFGVGLGLTLMPVFSGAMQSVTSAAAARASTVLNILQQTGASIGTAVLSVLLATELAHELGHGKHGAIGVASIAERAHDAGPMAAAFAHTFLWACVLLAIALIGSFALPKHKPEPELTAMQHSSVMI